MNKLLSTLIAAALLSASAGVLATESATSAQPKAESKAAAKSEKKTVKKQQRPNTADTKAKAPGGNDLVKGAVDEMKAAKPAPAPLPPGAKKESYE